MSKIINLNDKRTRAMSVDPACIECECGGTKFRLTKYGALCTECELLSKDWGEVAGWLEEQEAEE